ncbi:MAG: transposase [Planctomycetota bacterium]
MSEASGSALNNNTHFHALVLDGVFTREPGVSPPRFHPLATPSQEDTARLLEKIRDKILATLRRRGLLPAEDAVDEALAPEAPLFAACRAASVSGLIALGPKAGSRVARRGYDPLLARLPRATAGAAALEGFTLHNGVRIAGRDRGRLERLVRYMCRPPFANERLSMSADGRVCLELRRPFSDGSTHILFAPLIFIEKLAGPDPATLLESRQLPRRPCPQCPGSSLDRSPHPATAKPFLPTRRR